MMYNQQDLHGNTSLYPWMSQLYMVVHFQMFTASNNLEGLHVALRICCADSVCVHMCVKAMCKVSGRDRDRERDSQTKLFQRRAPHPPLGSSLWNPRSVLESDLVSASVDDAFSESCKMMQRMCKDCVCCLFLNLFSVSVFFHLDSFYSELW